MIALLAASLAVAPVADRLPSSWVGVWKTRQGQVVTITRQGQVEMMFGERHLLAISVNGVPDGSFFGGWQGTPDMVVAGSTKSRELRQYGSRIQGPLDQPHPERSRIVSNFGDIRLRPQYTGQGNLAYLAMTIRDGNGATKLNETLTPGLSLDAISVAGTFEQGPLSVTLRDSYGVDTKFEGQLRYNQSTFALKAERKATRGAFELIEPSTGRKAGGGYFEWAPTPSRVAQFASGNTATDQLIVFVYLSNGDLPAGLERTLARKG